MKEDFITKLRNKLISDKFKEHFDEMNLEFTIYKILDEKEQLEKRITKAIDWIYTVQQNKDNKHLEPIISTDELDEVLEILGGGVDDE